MSEYIEGTRMAMKSHLQYFYINTLYYVALNTVYTSSEKGSVFWTICTGNAFHKEVKVQK